MNHSAAQLYVSQPTDLSSEFLRWRRIVVMMHSGSAWFRQPTDSAALRRGNTIDGNGGIALLFVSAQDWIPIAIAGRNIWLVATRIKIYQTALSSLSVIEWLNGRLKLQL